MTPSQLEQLRDFLADKTLSFGCRLLYQETREVILNNISDYGGLKRFHLCGEEGWYRKESFKILGHTVTLARVLWMMEKENLNDIRYSIGTDGKFMEDGDEYTFMNIISWNLEKDDLMDPSNKPAQDFLWNIFKPLIEKK